MNKLFLLATLIITGSVYAIEYDKNFDKVLGKGILTLLEKRQDNCVTNSDPVENSDESQLNKDMYANEEEQNSDEVADGASARFNIKSVNSVEDVIKNINLSVGAEVKLKIPAIDPANLSLKTKFIQNLSFKDNFDYYLLSYTIKGKSVSLKDHHLRLKEEYQQKENQSLDNYISSILSRCGDSFLYAQQYGGYLYAVIEKRKTKESKTVDTKNEGSLSGNLKGKVDGSIDVDITTKNIDKFGNFSGTVTFIQQAGKESTDFPQVQSMSLENINEDFLLPIATSFPDIVLKSPVITNSVFISLKTLIEKGINLEITKKYLDESCKRLESGSDLVSKNFIGSELLINEGTNVEVYCQKYREKGDYALSEYIRIKMNQYANNQENVNAIAKKYAGLKRLEHELNVEAGIHANKMGFDISEKSSVYPEKIIPIFEIYQKASSILFDGIFKKCLKQYENCDLVKIINSPELAHNFDALADVLVTNRNHQKLSIIKNDQGEFGFKTFDPIRCSRNEANILMNNLTKEMIEDKESGHDLKLIGHFVKNGKPLAYLTDKQDKGKIYNAFNITWTKSCVWTATKCKVKDKMGQVIDEEGYLIYQPLNSLKENSIYVRGYDDQNMARLLPKGEQPNKEQVYRCVKKDEFVGYTRNDGCLQACFVK